MAEEERVIREIPVFLSKALEEHLYLIQYPQRPFTSSMDDADIIQVYNITQNSSHKLPGRRTRMKPQQSKIQMTIQMDTDSDLYDPELAEMLAEAAEGIGLDENKYMPDHRLKIDKTTMESTTVPKLTADSRYVIGVLRNGQLTLTPLKSIVQMKTVFPYLNKAEKARTAFQKEQAGGDTEDEGEDTEATKVTVKFSRGSASGAQGSAPKGPTRVSSYSARKKEEDEPWVELEYVRNDRSEFAKLCSPNVDSSPFYVLSRREYLQQLFPKHVETSIEGVKDKKNLNPKISIQEMRDMKLQDQCRVLLMNAKLLQYHQVIEFLRTKLKSDFDDTSLLKAIQTVGILVQGCWVVRSDVIYPEEFKSSVNGISGPIMQRARDIILSRFTETRFVERKQMSSLTKLPSEEVTDILSQVSRIVPSKKEWEFALGYDSKFIVENPEVVQRQTMIWEMKKSQRSRRSSSISAAAGSGGDPSVSPPRRRRSRNKSLSSDSESDTGAARRSESGRRQRRPSARAAAEVGIPSKAEM